MSEGRTLTRRDRAALWLGFLGPVAAWSTQLVVGYAYEEAACSNATGVDLVEPIIVGISIVAGAVAVTAGLGSAGLWRGVRRGEIADPRDRVHLMAIFGIATSVILLLGIAMSGLQLVALAPCTTG